MDSKKRLQIITEYGRTLEKATTMDGVQKKMAFPESLLPYPREEIQEALIETLKIYEEMRAKIKERFKDFPEESQKELNNFVETLFEGKTKSLIDVINHLKFSLNTLKDFIPNREWASLSNNSKKNMLEWLRRRGNKKVLASKKKRKK